MRLDAHQHFWLYNEVDYDWIGPGMEVLKRDRLPVDLALLLQAAQTRWRGRRASPIESGRNRMAVATGR